MEFFKELTALAAGPRRGTTRAKNYLALGFPSDFETIGDLAARLEQALVYRLPDDYFATYVQKIEAVTVADAQRVAQSTSRPRAWPSSSRETAPPSNPASAP